MSETSDHSDVLCFTENCNGRFFGRKKTEIQASVFHRQSDAGRKNFCSNLYYVPLCAAAAI